MVKLGEKNVRIGLAMTDDEEWLRAGAALIAHTASDPKPLADLLRSRREIPEATIHLLAALLDPPPTDPLGMRLKIVETHIPTANLIDVRAQGSEHGRSHAMAKENVEHEPWHGTAIRSAIIFFETTILAAKRYTKHLMKWVNHDI
jgi:hypothetical protein